MERSEPLSELEIARGKAWSFPGAEKPTGRYLGSILVGTTRWHYYKDGENYYFESDFDIEMRKRARAKKRARWNNMRQGAGT